MTTEETECAWCGAGTPDVYWKPVRWHTNLSGEVFCCKSHRDSSNRALKRFLNTRPEEETSTVSQ